MTLIKLCGLMRPADIEAANRLGPDYVGFVFAPKSRRFIGHDKAEELRGRLRSGIKAVGVFTDEAPEVVAALLERGVIDLAQLHGDENERYLAELRRLTDRPVIRAFRIRSPEDIRRAQESTAEHLLLDSGAGTGETFDWSLAGMSSRPYFLAGGLTPENVGAAIRQVHPLAVDVSSGIETDGSKDEKKMAAFVAAVRKEDRL